MRRRWDDGTLLRALAGTVAFEGIEVPLRGPRPSQIGEDVAAVQEWVARLDEGRAGDRRYALQWREIGGRSIGRNRLPARAVVSDLDQAWALLGLRSAAADFEQILRWASGHPAVRAWVCAHPLRALELRDEMPVLVAAYEWLDGHRGSQLYLRQISAPGVDTKFAEQHRGVLATMLGVPAAPRAFLDGLGLRAKPEFVRLRPGSALRHSQRFGAAAAGLSELAVRADEAATVDVEPRRALVVENEVSYLSVDVPHDGLVIWGKGFDVDRVGRLPWLAGVAVRYWGDIDTHGFAILDRLRSWLPGTQSVLMDRDTLLRHRDRWGREERPAHSSLTRLTPGERDLYDDLVSDRLGDRVRLEQERIDWTWARERLG